MLIALLLLAQSAFAVERLTDTRTALPENVIKERKSWGADASLGADLISGNVEQKAFSGSFSTMKVWQPYTAYLLGKANVASAFDNLIRREASVTARVDRDLSERWKVFAFTTHGMNRFLLLDYRGQVGAGPWYSIREDNVRHGFSLSLAYQFETYMTGEIRRYTRASLRYVVTWQVNPNATLGFDCFVGPALNNSQSVRVAAFPYVEAKLYKDYLGLKIQASYEYDGRPLATVKRVDTSLSTALVFHAGE